MKFCGERDSVVSTGVNTMFTNTGYAFITILWVEGNIRRLITHLVSTVVSHVLFSGHLSASKQRKWNIQHNWSWLNIFFCNISQNFQGYICLRLRMRRSNFMHFWYWCKWNPIYLILCTKQTSPLALVFRNCTFSNPCPLNFLTVPNRLTVKFHYRLTDPKVKILNTLYQLTDTYLTLLFPML
jgi:hypothetical protein